ncbi:MAG: hypothetical protein WB561_00010 [Terracidiphilus sp.]
MKFCCREIEELHENSGLREFAVFTARYPDGFVFVLQHRALDPDALPPFTESPMSTVSELLLKYCPWCGVNLNQFYCDQLEELDRSGLKLGMGR